jgi:S-adenosylmethionine synthetase
MLNFDHATPDTIADAISHEIGRQVSYRPVERHGAAQAATLIAQLL